MRAVVQRVSSADVVVAGASVGSIGTGLLILIAVASADTVKDAQVCADKIADLRIFSDRLGKMNRSVEEIDGSILVVSQFTLAASVRKGRRPSFTGAADPSHAEPILDSFRQRFDDRGIHTETGQFGASMQVRLVNDGPVTFIVETADGAIV